LFPNYIHHQTKTLTRLIKYINRGVPVWDGIDGYLVGRSPKIIQGLYHNSIANGEVPLEILGWMIDAMKTNSDHLNKDCWNSPGPTLLAVDIKPYLMSLLDPRDIILAKKSFAAFKHKIKRIVVPSAVEKVLFHNR
jgi:hypothetical protein